MIIFLLILIAVALIFGREAARDFLGVSIMLVVFGVAIFFTIHFWSQIGIWSIFGDILLLCLIAKIISLFYD